MPPCVVLRVAAGFTWCGLCADVFSSDNNYMGNDRLLFKEIDETDGVLLVPVH